MDRYYIPCDICSPVKPGYLWLRGNDWVECPQCVLGQIEVVEQKVEPKGKVFIPGYTNGATIFHPEHSRRF